MTPFTVPARPRAPPALGRASIEALHREWTQGGENKQLTVIDAGGEGNLAWCHSAYSEGDVSSNGTSLSVCVRQADGRWLIRICMLNRDDRLQDVNAAENGQYSGRK